MIFVNAVNNPNVFCTHLRYSLLGFNSRDGVEFYLKKPAVARNKYLKAEATSECPWSGNLTYRLMIRIIFPAIWSCWSHMREMIFWCDRKNNLYGVISCIKIKSNILLQICWKLNGGKPLINMPAHTHYLYWHIFTWRN